jgi:hypothetical protein
METKTIFATDLIEKAKGKSSSEICNLVKEWAESREDKSLHNSLKWLCMSGILIGNISILLEYIIALEKKVENLNNQKK